MKSRTTEKFRRMFANIPNDIQDQARKAYRLFRENPHHPSLHFKKVHPTQPIYSARVNRNYRVVGVLAEQEVIWFWIGPTLIMIASSSVSNPYK